MLRLTEKTRELFKTHIGRIIRGPIPEPYLKFKEVYNEEFLISVGDVVTKNLLKIGIRPDVVVIDGKSMRTRKEEFTVEGYEEIRITNPAGLITDDLWDALKTMRSGQKIFIEGEEDLASLPAILFAPEGALVLYGIPEEGIEIIKANKKNKKRIKKDMEKMEVEK
ncbi:MAG: DUF359 domain-containing protein [Euryarchaeota archaeon]|nr:DUF359 domain-containing protein [Euryarchaeota archaeon]